jgi:dolichol-phosphate mannosyltransferase
LFKLWTARLFYRLIRALGVNCVQFESGDFRLMSREGLKALNSMRERHRFIRGMVGWVGFRTAEVLYARQPRMAGTTKYSFRKMFCLAMDAIFSFSQVPLRLAYVMTAAWTVVSVFILAFLAADVFLFQQRVAAGTMVLALLVSVSCAQNFLGLGILGEYVGRIYEQSQDRPLYLVRELTDAWSDRRQNVA